MSLLTFTLLIVGALIINVLSVFASIWGTTLIYNTAKYVGAFGVVMVFVLIFAAFDAFTQIWVARPGYEGQPVFFSFWALGASTTISAIVSFSIACRFYSDKNMVRSIRR